MKAKQTGFTLIELMFTIVVLAVLLGVGVPNFRDFLRNSRMTAAANDLVTDFSVARTEAVKRRVAVTLCKSQDGAACDPASNTDPFNRWIVFVDDANAAAAAGTDGNGTVDSGEVVLRQRQLATSITVTTDGRKTVFLPTGFPNSSIAGNVTQFRLCDSRGNSITGSGQSAARAVTLSTTGRPSATRDKAKITSLGGC